MPASTTARKKQNHTTRRPRGVTQFPGSHLFAKEQGVSHSHVFRVLTGERISKRLVAQFNDWLTQRGMPWPSTAAVKPE